MDSSYETEDFPVDNLIEELNNFVESCSQSEERIKSCAPSNNEERKACSSYMKQKMQEESNAYLFHRTKNKRKSGVPVKNPKFKSKLGLNSERSFNVEKKRPKIRKDQSDGEEESPLIIDESKRKKSRSSMIQTGDIPEEVLNVIVKSGIDDQLENVAMEQKLTETIVKNIIKQVVTNKSVQAMIKKDIYGVDIDDSDLETFEPKLTRAKTKELIEKQIITPEEMSSGKNPLFSTSLGESPNSISVTSETSALVTTEFPEDEDDEEYHPEFDETVGSDEESVASSYGSPSYTHKKTKFSYSPSNSTTLRNCLSSSPKSLLKEKISNQCKQQMAQRNLNFSLDESLICSRTRSKCPLTDTPLEHLEMAFEPPDITADMYDTEVADEDWGKFLLDLSKPTDAVKQAEDDEWIDPEYNLMADTDEKSPSLDELREEFRGDRAVRISKREVHELVTDSLSCLESEDEDQEDEVLKQTCIDDGHNNLSALQDTATEENILMTPKKASCLSKSLQQENQDLNEFELSEVSYKLSGKHLEIVEYQIAQHTQLLLQSVLMCCYEEKFNHIEAGCNHMLKDLENLIGKTFDGEKIRVCNVLAAQNTIHQYNKKREEYLIYRKDKENRKMENSGTRYYERSYFLCFPHILQTIMSESCAFVFFNLLPKRIFNRSKEPPTRRGFLTSEQYLLAMSFKEIVPDIKIFNQESRNKKAKYFDLNLSQICDQVAEHTIVTTTGNNLRNHLCRLLKENIYKGLHEDNPLIKYTKTGIVELPEIDLNHMEVLSKENLRPLKNEDPEKLPIHIQKMIKKFSNEQRSKPCFSGVLNGRRIIVVEMEKELNIKKS